MLLTFEAIHPGHTWTSSPRIVTEEDVMEFARLTGDYDPLHVDEDFASQSPFGRPIAHGLLGLSLVAGLGSDNPRAATAAFVAVREWRFLRPIYFGDTVHVVTEVANKRRRGRRHGLVTWKRRLVNQDGETVQEGTFETLVRTQAALEALQAAKA
ncbi:MAG: MaoC family dehydratase [Pirellulaceae bacterium]